MRKTILSLVVVIFSASGAVAQMSVEDAFRKEDARAFEYHFHSQVEMALPGKDSRYKRADAVALMQAFFSAHVVQSFKKVHSGSSRSKDSNYYIGELATDKGVYRVYIYYDVHDGRKDIQEMRIEKK